MEGEQPESQAQLFPTTVGEKLRAAREAKGMSLSDVATATRIPQRHLEAIESSNYGSLPSSTYALGFAKAYARAVGADEVAIARDLRGELTHTSYDRISTVPSYEMRDPTRSAPNGLVWITVIIALLIAVAAGLYYGTNLFRATAPAPETIDNLVDTAPEATNEIAPVQPGVGQVSLIATDPVWLRVTDGSGKVLFEKEMTKGERYDVPADAQQPRARTARPDRIQVTLNGSNVPPLSATAQTVDVEVSAAALSARGQGGAASASPTPTAARPTPRPPVASAPAVVVAPVPAAVPSPAATPAP